LWLNGGIAEGANGNGNQLEKQRGIIKVMKPEKKSKQERLPPQELERRVAREGVKLDHPQGKERFEEVLRRVARPKG
jgi:hypothetical protein